MADTLSDVAVQEGATLGLDYDEESKPPTIGPNSVIRRGTIIYDNVEAGPGFVTGHFALVREETVLGSDVLVGTQTVIDGASTVGDDVSMQTGVYVPRETTIHDRVFLGPRATLLNDPYPIRTDAELVGPTLESDVSIGANATVLPGVTVGEGSFVAAGAVVCEDVPPSRLAMGAPADTRELPRQLQGGNDL
jgi:acetyltransferase-like isoleucine patch superfamily enzyme